jgi:hypothetical protein
MMQRADLWRRLEKIRVYLKFAFVLLLTFLIWREGR